MLGITLPVLYARPDPKVATLGCLSGLKGMAPGVLRCIAAHTELIELPAGSRLTTQGRYVHMMFGIVAGTVELRFDEQVWWTVGPGGWVGAYALAGNCRAATTAVSREPVVAGVVGRADFRAYSAVPELLATLLR